MHGEERGYGRIGSARSGGGMRRQLTTLAGLCGLAAAQLPKPGPGQCQDTVDVPWGKHFYEITSCCIDGDKSKAMVWAAGCADGAYVDTHCMSGCQGMGIQGKFPICCTSDCCADPKPRGPGRCPEFSAGQFPRASGIDNCTDVVQLRFVWQRGGDMEAEARRWMDGLTLAAQYINGQGGIRMGRGKVGYVNITFTEYHVSHTKVHSDDAKIENYYVSLCGQPDVDVLLLPLPRGDAHNVIKALRQVGRCTKPVLTGSDAAEIFEEGYSSVWSPVKKSTDWAAEQVEFLCDLGAKEFVVVGDWRSVEISQLVIDAIENHEKHPGTKVRKHCYEDRNDGWAGCLTTDGLDYSEVAFIGLGHGQAAFETFVKFFQANEIAPQAAMYMDLTDRLFDDSNQKKLSWLYDMWLTEMTWNETMRHMGPAFLDPYAANKTAGDGTDFHRYMGGASDFAEMARDHLIARAVPQVLHKYHAKAAATLVMLQMAVEHAPGTDGFGLEFNQTNGWDPEQFNAAMRALDTDTFWGPIKFDANGSNSEFTMGVAQFRDGWKDFLVGPSKLLPAGESIKSRVIFPADWDCQLTSSCWAWWETASVVVAVGALVALGAVSYAKRRRKRELKQHVVRESLVGGAAFMPDAQLATKDVGARWHVAAQLQDQDQQMDSVAASHSMTVAGSRLLKLDSSSKRSRPVMFTDAHLHELQPVDWNAEDNVIGKGAYGMVYKATWRGQAVAVKQILLPEEPASERSQAREDRKRRVKQITKDFVTEVEVCCDLAHANLVRLLGFSTKDGLLMVQELMLGQSLDKQLYIECWRPSTHQIKRMAEGIAQGMCYLHSAFNDAAGQEQPIIHRDLKSPNLLLAQPPGLGPHGEVTVKISDFGLSRDKSIEEAKGTVLMTGCGSVLWMAPEMLLGRKYNEKIDVYSYAMCLLELVDGNLPWTGVANSIGVPNMVTSGRRPTVQLTRATDQMRRLICKCWHESPSKRPTFAEIVEELTGTSTKSVVAQSAPAGPIGMTSLLQQPGSLLEMQDGRDSFQTLEETKQSLHETALALEEERQQKARVVERCQISEENLKQSEKEVDSLRRQLRELRQENQRVSSGSSGHSSRRAKNMGVSRPASPDTPDTLRNGLLNSGQ